MTVTEWIVLFIIIAIVIAAIIGWWIWNNGKAKKSHEDITELHEERLEHSLEREEQLEEQLEEAEQEKKLERSRPSTKSASAKSSNVGSSSTEAPSTESKAIKGSETKKEEAGKEEGQKQLSKKSVSQKKAEQKKKVKPVQSSQPGSQEDKEPEQKQKQQKQEPEQPVQQVQEVQEGSKQEQEQKQEPEPKQKLEQKQIQQEQGPKQGSEQEQQERLKNQESQESSQESHVSHWQKLRQKLAQNNSLLGRTLLNILSRDNLDESTWEEIEDTLLMADVGVDSSEAIVENLRTELQIKGGEISQEELKDLLKQELLKEVDPQSDRRLVALTPEYSDKLCVTMMVGVNGTGKTTTAGKLARYLISEDKKVAFAAADTFRAAAADQLETWAKPLNVTVTRAQKDNADPASIAFEAVENAQKENDNVLLVDTAGRLQTKKNLMDELGKVRRVIEKKVPVAEVLLVLDATTGQNGLSQAKIFSEAIGITGIVLTKLDGSAKGGIVIAVQKELGVPVKLVGLGEGPYDLAPFDAQDFVEGIVG